MIIEQLKNAYEDKDCVIFACDQTREFSKVMLKISKGKVVICIKEAVFEYEDIA